MKPFVISIIILCPLIAFAELSVYSSLRMLGKYEQEEVRISLQDNSRMGVSWSDNRTFVLAELGISGEVKPRLFYGGYSFEWCSATFGLLDSISNTSGKYRKRLNSDTGLSGAGTISQTRREGVSVDTEYITVNAVSLKQDVPQSTGDFPKIELAYKLTDSITAFGAFAYIETDNYTTPAYHFGVITEPRYRNTYFTLSAYYSLNGGMYGMIKTGNGKGGTKNLLPVIKGSDVEDVKVYGGAASWGYKLATAAIFECGAGFQSASSVSYKNDDSYSFYTNVTFKHKSKIMFTPEIAYTDYGDDDEKVFQAGVQIRLDI